MKRITAPGMVDEASIRVVSGLRPKQRMQGKANSTDALVSSLLSGARRNQAQVCANPLDRMCELLLGWRILEDVGRGRSSKNTSSSDLERLPYTYPDYEAYLKSWEPLLIEEVKAGVLTNLPLNTKRLSKSGTAMISSQGSSSIKSPLTNLNAAFTGRAVENSSSNSKNGESQQR